MTLKLQGQASQRQPPALSARKHADLFENVVPGKQEFGQVIPRFSRAQVGGDPLDFLHQVHFWVQTLVRLGEVADLQAGAQGQFALEGRNLVEQGFQEGGLAGPIRPQDGGAFPAHQGKVGGREQWAAFVGVADLQVSRAQHQIA